MQTRERIVVPQFVPKFICVHRLRLDIRVSLANKISKVERQRSAGEGLASVTSREKDEWFLTVNVPDVPRFDFPSP